MNIYLDIGSNHNQDLLRAKKIIKECGELKKKFGFIEGVKFQLFKPDKLWSKDYRHSPKVEDIERNVLPVEFIPFLIEEAKNNNLEIGFTPFDFESLSELEPYSVDIYYKISSFDLLRLDFIEKVDKQSKNPLQIATGNSNNNDIDNALEIIDTSYYVLYACVSEYPAIVDGLGLYSSLDMVGTFNWNYGWSDHTKNIGVILKAYSLGVLNLELHVDLDDRLGQETKHGHVWTISELKNLLQIMNDFDVSEDCDISREPLDLRADPEDGLRPQKKYRSYNGQ